MYRENKNFRVTSPKIIMVSGKPFTFTSRKKCCERVSNPSRIWQWKFILAVHLGSTFYPIANACQVYEGLWNRSWKTWVAFVIMSPKQVSVSAWDKWRFMGLKGIIFSKLEWACSCSGISSSPQMLICEKMFEYPKAKAVTGPQSPNTGQQVLLQCIHLTETLIFLLLMKEFPKKLEGSPDICVESNPLGMTTEQFPEKRLCSHRGNRDLRTKRPRPSHF